MTELERPLLSLSAVANHRNLDCDRYEKCLNRAVKKKWRSFSCAKCSIFKIHLEDMKRLKEEEGYILRVERNCFYETGFM